METFLIKGLQLVAALSLLVLLHEFGHYLFARIFGIRVDKFYLFFNPGFSLAKYNPAANTLQFGTYTKGKGDEAEDKALLTIHLGKEHQATGWRATIYGIGWLPLGGYCKIAGMVDESMDKEQLAQPVQPHEFRGRPAYQRLLVMLGGVLFNFITAIVIYIGMAWHWGHYEISAVDYAEGFDWSPSATAAGFMPGDIPVEADGKPIVDLNQEGLMSIAEAKTVKVLRNHKTEEAVINLPEDFLFRTNEDKWLLTVRQPNVVDKVMRGNPAEEAGLEPGDAIISAAGIPATSMTELGPVLTANGGKEIELEYVRGGDTIRTTVTPSEEGKLGFQLRPITEIYPGVYHKYTLLEAVPRGCKVGVETLTGYVKSMRHVFSKEGAKSIGGFGALGSLFPEGWNWHAFWSITAFLSVALAFMNILPIPGLDGGHVLFLLGEIITGRQPSERVMEIVLYIGMSFLILLLIYANGMDIIRAFF